MSPMVFNLMTMLSSVSFWLAFVSACCVAYGMYVVAFVFESRPPGNGPNRVPIWKNQSKAYLPGNFGLALLVAVGHYYRDDVTVAWADATWFKAVAVLAGLATFVLARRYLYTPRDYSLEAWKSPSKRYHDFVMYFAFCAVAVYLCLPAYLATDWKYAVLAKLVGVFGLALWGAGIIYDFTHRETPNVRQHPTTYESLWKWLMRWLVAP